MRRSTLTKDRHVRPSLGVVMAGHPQIVYVPSHHCTSCKQPIPAGKPGRKCKKCRGIQ